MSNILLGSLTLVEETCCNCYTHFAMDQALNKKLRTNGGTFYCPNGHGQHYTETEVQKLTKQLENAKKREAWAEQSYQREYQAHGETKKEKANVKRQLTNTRKRIANGVCPCCHRTFVNIARHMTSKHPDFKAVMS